MKSFKISVASLVVVLVAVLPACSGQFTKSLASYIAPMTGPGAEDTAHIKVWTPTSDGKFPVFMWLMGTRDNFDNDYIFPNITEHMASNGFIAALPDYPNGDFCILDPCAETPCKQRTFMELLGVPADAVARISSTEKAKSLTKAIDALCALPKADCSLGVALAGHSQGAFLTVQTATIDARVTAVNPWSYGFAAPTPKEKFWCLTSAFVDTRIPKSKRRMVVAAHDGFSDLHHQSSLTTEMEAWWYYHGSDLKAPQVLSGYQCEGSVPPINCIQPDGSGYYIIAKSDYTPEDVAALKAANALDNQASHTFYVAGHAPPPIVRPIGRSNKLVPSFAVGSEPWDMKPMLDWLATAARSKEEMVFIM